MLDLADIPFFKPLPPEAILELRRSVEVRSYLAGSLICRKGETGTAFFAIASGGVCVQLGKDLEPRRSKVFLGPGQVFGEMSLLSGLPVSATVLAAKDTWVYVLEKRSFLHFLETQSVLHNEVLQTLIERIRHRSNPETLSAVPGCALVVISEDTALTRTCRNALFRVVEHYAPGSFFVDTVSVPKSDVAPKTRPAFFPPTIKPVCACGSEPHAYTTSESKEWLEQLIVNWRTQGNAGQHLILVVREEVVLELRAVMGEGDRILVLEDRKDHRLSPLTEGDFGLACFSRVRFGDRKSLDDEKRRGRWTFQLQLAEMEKALLADCPWENNRRAAPTLDWIARWLTGREIGIALGAGAACGFAHLGVLQVLEEAGIRVDYLCGSSMGGALALHYAMTGNVSRSIEMVREVSARNDKVVDITWFPRPALLHGKKSKEVARKTWGEITLAEFEKPAAAVAADLVRGDRFVFDRGLGSIAARATTAIPGIYPPIPHEGRLLVDGALVNRIPLDLLDERGCGLKMAVNVIPSPEHKNTTGCTDWQLMNKRFNEFLGLRHVIASSWALLAWWQGTTEAQSADIIFEPRTEKQSGYDFSSLDEMIEAGRIAAREKLAVVEKSVASLLKPGAP